MKTGRIESFDTKKKSGVIRLDEDGGDVPVHFSTSVCLGGFTHVGASYKRVLTLAADHFDWLHELFENSPKAAIDLNTDEREWHAVLHGVG